MITIEQVAAAEALEAIWARRHPGRNDPEVRQAGAQLVTAIDAMLAELYLLRGRTVSEARVHDDLTVMVKAERETRLRGGVAS